MTAPPHPVFSLDLRRRVMACAGLLIMAAALVTASFGGLLPSRALAASGSLTELVVCTPAGLRIIDLATGEERQAEPSAGEHSADLLCLLCLPLAGNPAGLSETGAVLPVPGVVKTARLAVPVGTDLLRTEPPARAHQARAPPGAA